MNRRAMQTFCWISRVPRACGDEPDGYIQISLYGLVFPAPAGMNRREPVRAQFLARVPRACGDEPLRLARDELRGKCSPRLRG